MSKQKTIALIIAGVVALGYVTHRLWYDVWLATHIFRSEGSIKGLLEPSGHVYVIGQLHAQKTTDIYPFLNGELSGHAATVHASGCFILTAQGAKGAFGVLTSDFKPVTASLNTGYNSVELGLVEVSSANQSSINVQPTTLLQYLEGMRACVRSE